MSEKEVSNGVGVAGEGEGPPQMPAEAPPPTPEEIVTPEVLDRIVKGYNEDCEWLDFSAELGTKIGDNYMSIMYAVEIQLKNRKTGDTETLHVMLKTMPRNAMRQQMINDSGAFIKDAKMYKEVLAEFVEFQKSRGLKDNEIFQGWPKCFVTFHDGKNDYLAMENLRIDGFKMANRQAGLDMEHATLALKSMAKFHAISNGIYGGDYDKIMEKYPWLEEKMFLSEDKIQEPMKMWMKTTMEQEAEQVRKLGPDFEKDAERVATVVDDKFWNKMRNMMGEKVDKAVINHGDCWTNNFLFDYKNDGSLKSLKFVDFQLARCSSRCIDLGYFIHSSLPVDILNGKEDTVLKIYFDEYLAFSKKLGVDTDSETWQDFKDEYQKNRFYGVLMGLMLAPMLCADAGQVPDMESITEEEFNADGAKDFMASIMGDLAAKKICALSRHHLSRCDGFE